MKLNTDEMLIYAFLKLYKSFSLRMQTTEYE